MPDVNVPLLGEVPKGSLFAGILAAGGVGAYLWYKHEKAKSAAAAAAVTKPVTPPGMAGYGYNAYGYASQYAYQMNPYGYGYGPAGYGFGEYGGGGLYGEGYGYGQTPPVTATTNAQWAQNATAALVAQGYTGTAVITALGLYLAGKPITHGSTQDNTIQAAIALEGDPPQAGPNGMPPGVNYQGGSGQGGAVQVPNILGVDANQAAAILDSEGFKHAANLSGPSGRSGYSRIVYKQNPTGGTSANKGSYVNVYWRYQKGT